MGLKTKVLRAYFAIVLGVTPLFGLVSPVSAEPGNFFVTFDAPSVAPGQSDVPVYVHLNSNGTNVGFAGCELDVDSTLAAFSHGAENNGSFTSDFGGPNGNFDGGGAPDQRLFYGNDTTGVAASSDIEVYVMFYDVSATASGSINASFDTADTGNCLINDDLSAAFTTITGTSGSVDVSGVTVTESSGSTDVVEGGATDTFDVVLDAEPASNVTINVSDDAQVNADVSSLVFTNANWDTPQTVTVTAVDDAIIEGSHTGAVSMNVDGASDPLYTGLTIDDVTANISDGDGLLVEFTQTTSSDNENSGGNLPQLVVSGGDTTGGSAETIDVSTTGGTATGGGDDYTFTSPETVTIPAGDYTSPQTVSLVGLSISADTDVESDETIIFGLSNESSGLAVGNADGDGSTESTHTYTINNDDGLLVELSTTSASDVENTGGNVPTLMVSGADTTGGSAETVDVNILGSSTADGADYTFSATTITIPAADYTTATAVPIGLTIDGDTTVEADDTIDLSLGSPSAGVSIGDADGASGVENTHTYTITNDDQLTAELTITTASDVESTGGNLPQILVNGTSDVATTIRVDDDGTGSATNGSDYTLTDPVDVTVPAAVYNGLVGTALNVPLTITSDQTLESDETIDITLSAPASDIVLADVDGADGVESAHTYTITDDDQLSVEFDVATDSANEDDGYTPILRVGGAVLTSTATIEVTDTGGGSATGGGDDYTFTTPRTVTIPVGDYTSGTTTVNVPGLSVVSDGIIESDETVAFGLQNPSAGVAIADADAADGVENALTFTITNDDGLIVEFTQVSASDNENTGGNLPQVVVSGADTTGGGAESVDVTVTGGTATGGGDDYTFTDPETITFPAGDYTSAQTFSLSGLSISGDTNVESDETIVFGLTSLSGGLSSGDADGDATSEQTHTYTISNDDGLLVEFSDASASDVENSGGNVPTLTVSGGVAAGTETVNVTILGSSTANGSDYTAGPTTVTIPAGDYSVTPGSVSLGLTISGDTTVEANDTINLSLGTPVGVSIGDADGVGGVEDAHTYTINNDDNLSVEFSVASASDNEATGGNKPVVLVSGTSDVAASITVDDLATGSATGGTDYTFTDPTVINIPAGTYDGTIGTAQTFSLTINNDAVIEPNETIIFDLVSPSYTALADVDGADGIESRHTYTITNDDTTSGDSDNDGISDEVEDAGPNGGDANGDGTQDSAQSSVTAIVNGLTGEYNVLELTDGCTTIDSFDIKSEASQVAQDGNYDYPYGLKDFTLTCASAGDGGTVAIILDKSYDTTGWIMRKLNRGNSNFSDLPGAAFNSRTIAGKVLTTVTYSITDGGSVDEDGVVNAVFVDPVGIGVVAGAADELSETGSNVQGTLIAGMGLVTIAAVLYRTTRRYAYYTIRKNN